MQKNKKTITARILDFKIVLAVLGLLLFIPYIYFIFALENLSEQETKQLYFEAKEQLLAEMQDFRNCLTPQNYVEKTLEQVNKEIGLNYGYSKIGTIKLPQEYDPKFITRDFPKKFIQILKKKHKIEPMFLISSNTDLKETFSYFSKKYFAPNPRLNLFAEASILSAADFINLSRVFSDSKSGRKRLKALAQKIQAQGTAIRPERIFHILFMEFVSPFYSILGNLSGTCKKCFLSKPGAQTGYQYIFKILGDINKAKNCIYAVYFINIPGSELFPPKILEKSLQSQNQNIIRSISKNSEKKQTGLIETSANLTLVANLPPEFFQVINDFELSNPTLATNMLKALSYAKLTTSISKDKLTPKYSKIIKILHFSFKLLLLLWYSGLIYFSTVSKGINLNLNFKLKLSLSLLISIPIIGVFILVNEYSNDFEKTRTRMMVSKLFTELEGLNQVIRSAETRHTFGFLQLKAIITKLQQYSSSETFFPLLKKETIAQKIPQITYFSVFFPRSGQTVAINPDYTKNTNKDTKFLNIGLYRLLERLRALQKTTKKNKKFAREKQFYGSFADGYWNVYGTSQNIGKESLLIHDFSATSPLRRCCLQLIPSKNGKQLAGIICHKLANLHISRELISSQQTAKHSFKSISNGYFIDLGIFGRSIAVLRNSSSVLPGKTYTELRKIASLALSKRSSGYSMQKQANITKINAWRFIDNQPYIFVAQATILNETNFLLFARVLPWLMVLFSLLLIFIFSDLLSYLFLLPIKTLKTGFEKVRKGLFHTKVVIGSGDEFDNMADSFNNMSNGLLERERMKRFVSDKLYEKLNETTDNASETIVSILSSDVRDFTTISEKYSPTEIVSFLNDYITVMEKCILKYNGSIEKIIGDAIVAGFYPESETDKSFAIRSVKASLEMRKELAKFNILREQQNLFTVENGIGIATGQALMGFLGKDSERKDFILIGNVIEQSEILESQTKQCLSSKILIDKETKYLLQNNFELIPFKLKDTSDTAWEIKND